MTMGPTRHAGWCSQGAPGDFLSVLSTRCSDHMPNVASGDAVKVTDVYIAFGTVGAVLAAVVIAVYGTWRDNKLRRMERAYAEEKQRRDRDVGRLLRAVDIHAAWKHPTSNAGRDVELQKLLANLGLLPEDVALLIRRDADLLPYPLTDQRRKAKIEYLAGDPEPSPGFVDGYLIAREVAIDIGRLSVGDDREFVDGHYWWEAYDQPSTP